MGGEPIAGVEGEVVGVGGKETLIPDTPVGVGMEELLVTGVGVEEGVGGEAVEGVGEEELPDEGVGGGATVTGLL